MALEVPERAVIGQNIKAIVGALERTPGTLASVGSGADVRLDHLTRSSTFMFRTRASIVRSDSDECG